MNPPPPGGAPAPDVRVRMVPAATLFAAVPLLELPAALAVVNESTTLLAVHVVVVVDGVTLYSDQVVAVPVYEKMVRLGLHAVGTTTVAVAPRATA